MTTSVRLHPEIAARPRPRRRCVIAVLLPLLAALVGSSVAPTTTIAHDGDVSTGWWIDVPTAKVSTEVFVGGQSTIDGGHATLYDGWGFTVAPGEPGTTWIAGHRTTKGKVFRRLPRVKVGDAVTITTADAVYTYRISTRVIVGRYGDSTVMFSDDPNVNRLLLQCSWTKGRAVWVAGDLESVTPLG